MEVNNEFTYYRRNLPHWQVGGSTYFITFRAKRILNDQERNFVKQRVLFGDKKKFDLYFGVVMPDHAHLLLKPLQMENSQWYTLPEILRGIKGSSGRDINKLNNSLGNIWQKESFDRLIRDENELYEKWQYIWNNPIKWGLSMNLKNMNTTSNQSPSPTKSRSYCSHY